MACGGTPGAGIFTRGGPVGRGVRTQYARAVPDYVGLAGREKQRGLYFLLFT